jgi:hypothetical protein
MENGKWKMEKAERRCAGGWMCAAAASGEIGMENGAGGAGREGDERGLRKDEEGNVLRAVFVSSRNHLHAWHTSRIGGRGGMENG